MNGREGEHMIYPGYRTSEDGARFLLLISSHHCNFCDVDDIGRGYGETVLVFGSDEARRYFIEADKSRRLASREAEIRASLERTITVLAKQGIFRRLRGLRELAAGIGRWNDERQRG